MFFPLRRCRLVAIMGIMLLALALSVVRAYPATGKAESVPSFARFNAIGDEVDKRIYSLIGHLVRAGIYLTFSAVFAGLTIGIMCMDMLTIDIIANSGPEPDRTYASKILPLRRQGHQTLCTLILSNMLMNVLVVQEIGIIMDMIPELGVIQVMQKAGDNTAAITGFVTSTLFIIIFAEIIPMSICKSKYSLRIAAAGCVLVRIAKVLVYPAAMPFGMLLDYLVPHDAGQIYDRNELRKLMLLHCEAHGDRSGLVKSEVQLLIAAMDFHERRVVDIMKPIEEVITVRADEVITADVVERLWNSGCSRIAVEASVGWYTDVLLLKDLLTIPMPIADSDPITIGELVKSKSRAVAIVHKNTSLPTLLKFFQHAKTHLLLVFGADDGINEVDHGEESEIRLYSSHHRRLILEDGYKIVGFVTLEDVVEALIEEEIYDEYDHYESSVCEHSSDVSVSVPVGPKWIPAPPPEPMPVPRVNFCSYYVHASTHVPLTEAQVWAVAYYLTRAVRAFYLWVPGYVKMLLEEIGDRQLVPALNAVSPTPTMSGACGSGSCSSQLSSPQKCNQFKLSQASLELLPENTIRSNTLSNLISQAADESFVLYREGIQATAFTLVLSGGVDVTVGSSNLPFKRRSFQWLAEEALTSPRYIPDFDAVVLSPTRVYIISRETYEKYLFYNTHYLCDFEGNEAMGKRSTVITNHSMTQAPSAHPPVGTTLAHSTNAGGREKLLEARPCGNMYGTFDHAEK